MSMFRRKIDWTNFGKTAVGVLQVMAGVGLVIGAHAVPVLAPVAATVSPGLIKGGIAAIGIGLAHKLWKATENPPKGDWP